MRNNLIKELKCAIMLEHIVSFCENAAELGCPRNQDVDMWVRELSVDDAMKVMEKLCKIMKRNKKLALNDMPAKKAKKCSVCKKKVDKGDQITRDWLKGLLKK